MSSIVCGSYYTIEEINLKPTKSEVMKRKYSLNPAISKSNFMCVNSGPSVLHNLCIKKCAFLLMVVLMFTFRLSAQEEEQAPKVKFEKVSVEELTMKSYPNDTTAEAVILYDDGTSYVKYDAEKGFMLTYDRFVRIKILRQSGVDWGNFFIPLYSSGQIKEELYQVKGSTTNFENGKSVRSELKKESVFRERENKFTETVRLSMPSVKIGSVIDLRYSITTELIWNLRTWKFQYTIPVKWSKYRVVYPEYFTYNHSSMGYHSLLYNKKNQKQETINFTVREETSGSGFLNTGTREMVNQTITYLAYTSDYAAKDIPAMKGEPYLTALDNFTTQVKFELANVDFTRVGGKFKNYTTSWNEIAQQLTDDESFGKQLKTAGFAEDAVAQLTKGTKDSLEKLKILYQHVQKTMKWDGYNTIYASRNLKKAYTDKTGNSADINLLLIAMLNKAGITAYPVVLSTRQNGMLSFSHATLSDCNYVIAQAIVDGKPILLDATEPRLQAGFIPFRCLNGEGHQINNAVSESVDLVNARSAETAIVQLEIKEGKMSGIFQERLSGLSAFDFREKVTTAGGKQEYFDKLKNSSAAFNYLSYQYTNLDSLNLAVYTEYKVTTKEEQEPDASILYIDPVLINRHTDNPFTSPTREYPVDFGVPFSEGYNLQLTIPDGYKVDEMPESTSLVLEGKAGQFLYQVSQMGNKIVLNLRFSIDKTQFIPAEYEALKNLYNLVINKEAEQIILKKITI